MNPKITNKEFDFQKWEILGLSKKIIKNLEDINFNEPTIIQ